MSLVNSHSRLLKQFTALGPYLRESKCDESVYFFDCLSVCVSAKPNPEQREFWGWWFELNRQGESFEYDYQFGYFDKAGLWQVRDVPAKHQAEVEESLQKFFNRLHQLLDDKLTMALRAAPQLADNLHLSAA